MSKAIYDQIHIKLAERFNTTVHVIAYVRMCNYRLHISRAEMAERQNKKMHFLGKDLEIILNKIQNVPNLIAKFPQNREKWEKKSVGYKAQIPMHKKGIDRRLAIRAFLERITDEDFAEIVKPLNEKT